MTNTPLRRWHAIVNRVTTLSQTNIFGVEVGVYKGAMSKALLELLPTLHLDLVDRWCETPPGDSYFDGSLKMSRMSQKEFDEVFQEARRNVLPFKNRCKIYYMESVDAASYIPDSSRDFVFIDADHSYIGVTKDLKAWTPKVKPGGWICGHDYDHPKQGQVKEAIHDFFSKEYLDRLELDVQRTWFIRL